MQKSHEQLNNVNPQVDNPNPTEEKDGIQLKSDKLRNAPMGKLLFSMALPAIISMLIEAMYNIVDGMYISALGQEAFDALGIGRPLIMIVIAVGIGLGVGANVFVARQLGFGDREKANQVAKTAFVLAIIAWAVFFVLAFLIPKPFVKLFTSSQATVNYHQEYVPLYMMASLFCLLSMTGSKILQATGNMRIPMISQICGCVTNIILDPIFIFKEKTILGFINIHGFGLGMRGAIIATVIGQFVACAIVLYVFLRGKQDVQFFPAGLRFSFKNVKDIFNIGLPNFVLNAVGSFTTIILNSLLKQYDNGITILTIYFTCQSFVFMPTFGLTQGATPIMSYNYGANLKHRFDDCLKKTLITAMCFMFFGFALFQICPEIIVKMFMTDTQTNPQIIAEATTAFRTISWAFLLAGISVITITLLQSLNVGMYAMLMSLLRQLGFIVPLAYILNSINGLDSIFLCYPLAEVLTLAIFLPIAIKKYKKIFEKRALLAEQNTLNLD